MLLFSATFEDAVLQFAEQIIPDPNIIKLRREEMTLTNIRQFYFLCENKKDKYKALCNIYGSITVGQAIIFCQVKLSCCCYAHSKSQIAVFIKIGVKNDLSFNADGNRVRSPIMDNARGFLSVGDGM